MAQQLSSQQIERVRLEGARGIAELLEGWSLEEPGPDWNGSHLALEEASTGRRLELVGCHATTRVEIRARVPRAPGSRNERASPDENALTIGLDFRRPPEHLVRDLKRRLMDGFDDLWRGVLRFEPSRKAADGLLAELASIYPSFQVEGQRELRKVSLHDALGSIEVRTGIFSKEPPRVYLKLHVSGELAGEILHLLKEKHHA